MKNTLFSRYLLFVILYIFLSMMSSCMSTKLISSSNLPESEKYHYIIHGQNIKFHLDNAVISNNVLTGSVNFRHVRRRKSVNIYPESDTVIKIDKNNVLRMSLDKTSRIELIKGAPFKTTLLTFGIILPLPFIYLMLMNMGWPG